MIQYIKYYLFDVHRRTSIDVSTMIFDRDNQIKNIIKRKWGIEQPYAEK